MGEQREKYQVCVVTGTRAEYGLLKPLLYRMKKNKEIDLKLVVTGSHLNSSFGDTQQEIAQDGFEEYIKVPIPIEDDSKEGMAISTGVALTKFAELFSTYKPGIIIVLGDRFEIFSVAIAAHLLGIPIAHIAGGDITEGAVDDAIRHCLTKLSYIHFPGCEQSTKRVIQMGEQPNRVFNVGELGIENCKRMKLLKRQELAENLRFPDIMKDYAVVTFHPVTMERNTGVNQVRELIKAMDLMSGMSYIITLANADAGGREINEIWIEEGANRKNWFVIPSLGVLRYLSAVKYARVVIGNSSSGIVEVPAMGVPTVNIGDRQKGRMMSESVICCEPTYECIEKAIQDSMTEEFRKIARNVVSLFGDGKTSEQIEKRVLEYLSQNDGTIEKHFYDIKF